MFCPRRQAVVPPRGDVVERRNALAFASKAPTLIIGDVNHNSIEKRLERGSGAEMGNSFTQTQENLLREVFEVLTAAQQSVEKAKHARTLLPDEVFNVAISQDLLLDWSSARMFQPHI